MPSPSAKTKYVQGRSAAGERKSRHAMEEFGPGKKEFIFCPKGEAVYFKKSWHHIGKFYKSYEAGPRKMVRFKLCPAHQMLNNKQYEGEVIIENVPIKFRRDLLNLIENFGERAMRKDVLDRILTIHVVRNTIRVATSENQLAQRMAQKIYEVFKKKVGFKISRAKEGDMVRIRLVFGA